MIDVCAYGKNSDAGVFSNTAFYRNISGGNINLPEDTELSNSD